MLLRRACRLSRVMHSFMTIRVSQVVIELLRGDAQGLSQGLVHGEADELLSDLLQLFGAGLALASHLTEGTDDAGDLVFTEAQVRCRVAQGGEGRDDLISGVPDCQQSPGGVR